LYIILQYIDRDLGIIMGYPSPTLKGGFP
jgi:hypothetical protein